MPSTEGEELNYLREPGPPAPEADLWAEGLSALTPLYMARNTETAGRFNVLIWASGLLFSVFIFSFPNHSLFVFPENQNEPHTLGRGASPSPLCQLPA